MKSLHISAALSLALFVACRPATPEPPQAEPAPAASAVVAASPPLVVAARRQVGRSA